MTRHSSGKGSRATTGGGPAAAVLAGIDDHAAIVEAGDADAGAAAARQQRRVAADVERQVVQRAQRRGDGKRDLRAGAEARMARDCLLRSPGGAGRGCRGACAERRQMRRGAFALGAFDQRLARPRQRDDGLGLAQRQADAAEAPSGCRRLGSRKPRCRRAGTLMVTEFDICPLMGAS